MGLPQVLRDSTHFVFSGYHIRDSSGTCHSSPALWFSLHRLNHKSQHTVLGHMYVVSYFSVVYFYGVNLNILCVDWLLLHIFCVVWFLVLSLRHCNCKSNLTAMRWVRLLFESNVLCFIRFPDQRGSVLCEWSPTNGKFHRQQRRPAAAFPLCALLYSTFPAYTLLFQFMLYALISIFYTLSKYSSTPLWSPTLF